MTNTARYIEMQKREYEYPESPPEGIVGNYEWHEQFPYETQLLYENGDVRLPLLPDERRVRALDFGCGPGRMIRRMSRVFQQVDGVDISSRLLREARHIVPANSQLFESRGDDLGAAPRNAYDFIYCTISMQHIAVWDVRMRIMRAMHDALQVGGCVTLQMAYSQTYPMIAADHMFETDGTPGRRPRLMRIKGRIRGFWLGNTEGLRLKMLYRDGRHAEWRDNRVDATKTNSGCDVTISESTLPQVREDFESLFGNFACWWYDVSLVLNDLRGARHDPNLWATHWIFLHARKTTDAAPRSA